MQKETNLTVFGEDSPVQAFPLQDGEKDLYTPNHPSGGKCLELSSSLDQPSLLLKTLREFSTEDYERVLPTCEWQDIAGITRKSYLQRKSEAATCEKEYLLLPTLTGLSKTIGSNYNPPGKDKLETQLRLLPTLRASDGRAGSRMNLDLSKEQRCLRLAPQSPRLDVALYHQEKVIPPDHNSHPSIREWMMGFPMGWTDEDYTVEVGGQRIHLQENFLHQEEVFPTVRLESLPSETLLLPSKQSSPLCELNTSIKSPAGRYYGGKWRIGKWISSFIPEHQTYIEPFGGLFSVGLQKPVAEIEVYNDLNPAVVNFWLQLRDRPEDLIPLILATKYDQETFEWCKGSYADPLIEAHRFHTECAMAYQGGGCTNFHTSPARIERLQNQSFAHLWHIARRIQNLQIYNLSAIAIIQQYDSPTSLFYLDPCYLPHTRSQFKHYQFEMQEKDHVELIEVLQSLQGKFLISGYENSLYDTSFSQFPQQTKPSMTTGRNNRQEKLWSNFTSDSILQNSLECMSANDLEDEVKNETILHMQVSSHELDMGTSETPEDFKPIAEVQQLNSLAKNEERKLSPIGDSWGQRSLEELEEIIHKGLKSFLEVGLALRTIQQKELYKQAGYTDFRKYCKETFDLDKSRAYRYINASEVSENVSPILATLNVRLNESNYRVLAPLAKEQQKEVLQLAADKNAGGKITSRSLENAVKVITFRHKEKTNGLPIPQQDTIVTLVGRLDPELKPYKNYWGVVTAVGEFSCDVRVMGDRLSNVHPQYLMKNIPADYDSGEVLQLLDRLDAIANSEYIDITVRNLLREIATGLPHLSEWQELFVSTAEKRIRKLSSGLIVVKNCKQ